MVPPGPADPRAAVQTEMAPTATLADSPSDPRGPAAEKAKLAPKAERKPASNPDPPVHTAAGPDLDRSEARNGSKSADPSPKREQSGNKAPPPPPPPQAGARPAGKQNQVPVGGAVQSDSGSDRSHHRRAAARAALRPAGLEVQPDGEPEPAQAQAQAQTGAE
ncbi:hypothetical protein COCON_G00137710, partial [Conger conger]